MSVAMLFAFIAIFLAIKAVERQWDTLGTIASIVAWVAAGITVILAVLAL